jgi:hypothetical protein
MVGTVIVNSSLNIKDLNASNKILIKTYNLLGKKTSKKIKRINYLQI